MGQTRKITNPNQSGIPFLNSLPAKQGTNPTTPPKSKQKKVSLYKHCVLSLYDLVSQSSTLQKAARGTNTFYQLHLIKDEGNMFDCYCAGLIHPVQNIQEQNPVFFTVIFTEQRSK